MLFIRIDDDTFLYEFITIQGQIKTTVVTSSARDPMCRNTTFLVFGGHSGALGYLKCS